MFEAKEIIPQNTDWITLVFFICLVILVYLKMAYQERLYHTSLLFFSKKNIALYFNKDKKSVFNGYQISFSLVQLLIISLLFYTIWSNFQSSFHRLNLKTYLILLSSVVLYFVFQYFITFLLSTIFDLEKTYKKILLEKTNYLNSLVLWVLGPLLFLTYATHNHDFLLWITLLLSALLLLIRYVLILKNNKNLFYKDFFYFILYLCALEIAPLVIILKLTI